MIDTPSENLASPEFRALTMLTSALADTLERVDLLETFVVKLQKVAVEAEADAPPEDPALKWVDAVTRQLVLT